MEELLQVIGEGIVGRFFIGHFKNLTTLTHRPRLIAHVDIIQRKPKLDEDPRISVLTKEILAKVGQHDDFPKVIKLGKQLRNHCPDFHFSYTIVLEDWVPVDTPTTTALVLVDRKPVTLDLSANDRRFLRSLRISAETPAEIE